MPIINVKDNENIDIVLRKFKRLCEKAGIISECRRHEFYEKPTWERKRRKAQAEKRFQKQSNKLSGHKSTGKILK